MVLGVVMATVQVLRDFLIAALDFLRGSMSFWRDGFGC